MKPVFIYKLSKLTRYLMVPVQIGAHYLIIYRNEHRVYVFNRFCYGLTYPLDVSGEVIRGHVYTIENRKHYSLETGLLAESDAYAHPLKVYKTEIIEDSVFVYLPYDYTWEYS